jgi:hypothetical protein
MGGAEEEDGIISILTVLGTISKHIETRCIMNGSITIIHCELNILIELYCVSL